MGVAMPNTDEIVACLQRVSALIALPGADLGWGMSRYESIEDLRGDVTAHLRRFNDGDFGEEDLRWLTLVFLPTGTLQEVSMATGWAEEFLSIAERIDNALASRA